MFLAPLERVNTDEGDTCGKNETAIRSFISKDTVDPATKHTGSYGRLDIPGDVSAVLDYQRLELKLANRY